jgi:ribosomal protein S18 acetylase RimI-like enzyme
LYTVEIAGPEDLEQILSVQKEAFIQVAERTGDYSIGPLTQTLDDLMEEAETSVVFKAIRHDRIVGSVRASVEESRVLIKRLVVLPEEQGRGIGKALLKSCEEHFISNKSVTQYYLFTDSNEEKVISFYSKLGYKPFKYEKKNEATNLVYMMKHKGDH